MKRTLLRSTLALCGLLAAAPAFAQGGAKSSDDDSNDEHSYATSVNGPGPGRGQGLVGMGGMIARGGYAAPGFALGYVYGFGDIADLHLHTDLGILTGRTGGVVGIIDPHVLFRLTGARHMEANVGLKFGPEVLWAAGAGGGVALFGVTPGLASSFGTSKFQASMGIDIPIFFALAGSVSGTGTTASIRPVFGLEGNLGSSINLFLKAGPLFAFQGGFAFVTITSGVTF